RVVRHVRHRAQSPADGAAGRRSHPLRRAAATPRMARARILGGNHAPWVVLLVWMAGVGGVGAGAFARTPRPPTGARRVPPVTAFAALARVGEPRAVSGDVHAHGNRSVSIA